MYWRQCQKSIFLREVSEVKYRWKGILFCLHILHVRELKIENRRRTKDLENLKNLFPGRSSGGGDLREDFSIVNETDRLAGRTSCDACPVTRPREINQSVGCVLTREGRGGWSWRGSPFFGNFSWSRFVPLALRLSRLYPVPRACKWSRNESATRRID